MDGTLHIMRVVARDVKCTIHFFGYTSIHRKIITIVSYVTYMY